MRRLLIATILATLLVLFTAGPSSATRGCVINVVGIKVCGTLLTPLPTVTVTLPPVTQTVTLPPLPGQTKTVRVPSGTQTVVVPGAPGATTTVTKQPQAGPTVGPGTPKSTVTKTQTVSPSGQPRHTHGTIGPSNTPKSQPFLRFDSPSQVVRSVGIGLLSLLALVGIILAGMAYAFRVGRRSAVDEDTNFMRAVLDNTKSRGRHR